MVALAGFLMSKSDKWWLHLLAMVAGEVVLYLIGTVWFCVQAGKTASAALAICVYPFIPLDIVKMVIVVLIGPMISSRLKKAHLVVVQHVRLADGFDDGVHCRDGRMEQSGYFGQLMIMLVLMEPE